MRSPDDEVYALHWWRIQEQKDVLCYLRTRSVCDPLKCSCGIPEGIVLPVDHSFWLYAFPPNGPYCRVHFDQVSIRGMHKKGLKVTSDADLPSLSGIKREYLCNAGIIRLRATGD